MNAPVKSPTLALLCQAWLDHKAAEKAAYEARHAIEAQIADMLHDEIKPEGSITLRTDGFKIGVTQSVTRKIDDVGELARVVGKLWADKVLRYKFELDVAELRRLQAERPDVYLRACDHITAKPGKPTFKIEQEG